jgi:hypothetical protein
VLCLGQFGDVFRSVAEGDERFAPRQGNGLDKIPILAGSSQKQMLYRTEVEFQCEGQGIFAIGGGRDLAVDTTP